MNNTLMQATYWIVILIFGIGLYFSIYYGIKLFNWLLKSKKFKDFLKEFWIFRLINKIKTKINGK